MWGAVCVGGLATFIFVFLLVRWWVMSPPTPAETAASDVVGNYKILREAVLSDTTQILDAFVVKILLPVFTSFVGYFFGSQVKKS